MNYLIRFAQFHETFREAELEALARLENVRLDILYYKTESPFCVVHLYPPLGDQRSLDDVARSFASRSILAKSIYELWGQGATYDLLHKDVEAQSSSLWQLYKQMPFKFSVDTYCARATMEEKKALINSFAYLGFDGVISMKNPAVEFVVFEEWEEPKVHTHDATKLKEHEASGKLEGRAPKQLFLGRFLGGSKRHLTEKHDLKKRPYISTTSMDAELALFTANVALASPGKLFLDPFVGTGGFMVAASELGALAFGADIDGRSFRGKGPGKRKGIGANFAKYGLNSLFGDCITSDLTNTPLRTQHGRFDRSARWVDGIIADPPYGIREGLKVLGTTTRRSVEARGATGTETGLVTSPKQPVYVDGVLAHTLPDYVAPKKQYSFLRMLDDILDFAARTLVDGGRLAFWMPSANELDQELALPTHPLLILKHVCVQIFNRWSRRLLVFERLKGDVTQDVEALINGSSAEDPKRKLHADELNDFRKRYFEGFRSEPA